jgi:hypothetical protein
MVDDANEVAVANEVADDANEVVDDANIDFLYVLYINDCVLTLSGYDCRHI